MKNLNATFHNQPQSRYGLLCIADISGFTHFVSSTDLESGSSITQALMQAIIDSNSLGLQVSEIEGDAVFFFKFGTPPSGGAILEQFEKMLDTFHQNLQKINQGREVPFKLELKLIVHYGEMSQYQLAGFSKLYGQSVVEVHRLLKGAVRHSQYALLTDDYVKNSGSELSPVNSHRQCKVLKALRKLCYNFFPYHASYAIA
jgi:Protein of unknown function (DUF2652)